VRTALQRIADGTYGTCFRCEREIAPKRLKALPWAAYCLACQTSADSHRRGMDHEEIAGVLGLAQRGA
jgi:DnaK suppressor protein